MSWKSHLIQDIHAHNFENDNKQDIIRVETFGGKEKKYRIVEVTEDALVVVDQDGVRDTINPDFIGRYRIEKRVDSEWKK